MENFKVTWQEKDKYHSFTRSTVINTTSEANARALCCQNFGNEKKIEIISVEKEETKEIDT